MIRLIDIILSENIKGGIGDGAFAKRRRDTWRVDTKNKTNVTWGARNSYNQVRFFNSKKKAKKYSMGLTKGRHPGRSIAKIVPNRKKRIQTYSIKNNSYSKKPNTSSS